MMNIRQTIPNDLAAEIAEETAIAFATILAKHDLRVENRPFSSLQDVIYWLLITEVTEL